MLNFTQSKWRQFAQKINLLFKSEKRYRSHMWKLRTLMQSKSNMNLKAVSKSFKNQVDFTWAKSGKISKLTTICLNPSRRYLTMNEKYNKNAYTIEFLSTWLSLVQLLLSLIFLLDYHYFTFTSSYSRSSFLHGWWLTQFKNKFKKENKKESLMHGSISSKIMNKMFWCHI